MNIHKYRSAIKEKVKSIAACHNHTLALTESNKIYGWGDSTHGRLLELEQNFVLRPTLINQNQFTFGQCYENDNIISKQNISVLSNRNMIKSQSQIINRSSLTQGLQSPQYFNKPNQSNDVSNMNLNRNSILNASSQFSPQLKHLNSPTTVQSMKGVTSIRHIERNNSQKQIRNSMQTNTSSNILNSVQLINSDSKRFLPSIQKKRQNFQSLNKKQSINLHMRNSTNNELDEFQTNRSIKGSLFSQKQLQLNQNLNSEPILLAVGSNHSLIYINGTLYSAGKQSNGVLGIGPTKVQSTKIPVPILYFKDIKLVGLAANFYHSLAWDDNGNIYSWGDGTHGQLGHPIEKGYSFNRIELTPKRIQLLQGKKIVQASCGKYYSSAITIEGELYGWGKGEYNIRESSQDDHMMSLIECLYPKKLMPEGGNAIHVKFVQVSCGVSHNATIDQFGRLYTWGDSSEYCLGHPKLEDLHQPKLVKILKDKVTIDVSCGDRFTVVIQEEDISGRKANVVDQFKQRNINNIRQKIKSLYDYSKMKINIGSDLDEKANEKIDNIKKDDSIIIDQNASGINLSFFQIAPDSPLTQRLDKDSPRKVKKLPKLTPNQSSEVKSSNSLLPQIHIQNSQALGTQQNIIQNTNRTVFELDLEELVEMKNSAFDIELPDSKDSQVNQLKNLKILLDKNYRNSKTYKAIQDQSQIKNMKELIKKHNRGIKENNLKVVNNGNTEEVSIIFDECSELLDYKEKNDPLYLPFITPVIDRDEDPTAYYDLNDDGNPKQIKNQQEEQILNQHSAMQQFLGNLLESKNEMLKYEYIEMVRRGMEGDHLQYLISDPKEGVIQNNREREKLKKKLNKKITKYTEQNMEVYHDTKEIIDSQKKYMNNLINKCRKAQEKAKNIVGKFSKHAVVDPTLLKPNKRYLPLLNVLNSSENYQKYLQEKQKDQSNQRSDRITQAIERREEIFLQKYLNFKTKLKYANKYIEKCLQLLAYLEKCNAKENRREIFAIQQRAEVTKRNKIERISQEEAIDKTFID